MSQRFYTRTTNQAFWQATAFNTKEGSKRHASFNIRHLLTPHRKHHQHAVDGIDHYNLTAILRRYSTKLNLFQNRIQPKTQEFMEAGDGSFLVVESDNKRNDWIMDDIPVELGGYTTFHAKNIAQYINEMALGEKEKSEETAITFYYVIAVVLCLLFLASSANALIEAFIPASTYIQLVWFSAVVGGAGIVLFVGGLLTYIARPKLMFSWRHLMSISAPLLTAGTATVISSIAIAIYSARWQVTFIDKSSFAPHFDGVLALLYMGGWFFLGFGVLIKCAYSVFMEERAIYNVPNLLHKKTDSPINAPHQREGEEAPHPNLPLLLYNRFAESRWFRQTPAPLPDGGSRAYYVFSMAFLLVSLQVISATIWSSELMGARYLLPNAFAIAYGLVGFALILLLGYHFFRYRTNLLFDTTWRQSTEMMVDVVFMILYFALGLFAVFYWVHFESSDASQSPVVAPTTEYISYKLGLLIQVLTTLPNVFILYRFYWCLIHTETSVQQYMTLQAKVIRSEKYAVRGLPVTKIDPMPKFVNLSEIQMSYDTES